MKAIFALLIVCCSLHGSRGPDFMVIGTAKGGTTSLYDYLNDHPLIEMPETKEINYYYRHYDGQLDKYRENFPVKNSDGYPLSGDVTPEYMVIPEVPGRVLADFPDTKVIILLRNPVDRAFSHYKQHLFPKRKASFEEALDREFTCLRQGIKYTKLLLLQRGFYAEQLRCWLNCFPKERFLILISEDFYANPQEAMDKVYAFLELPPHKHESFPVRNQGRNNDIALKRETEERLKKFYRPLNKDLQHLLDELELDIQLTWD